MREATQVPPLSDILRTAAGLGVDVQTDALPASAMFLYQTIYDSLVPDLYLNHEQRHCIALDTAILLCATHDSERLLPANVSPASISPPPVFGGKGSPLAGSKGVMTESGQRTARPPQGAFTPHIRHQEKFAHCRRIQWCRCCWPPSQCGTACALQGRSRCP